MLQRLPRWKSRNDPGAKFFWRRTCSYYGTLYRRGDPVPEEMLTQPRRLRGYWEKKRIELRDATNNPDVSDLKQALMACVDTCGKEVVMAVLARFRAAKLSEVPEMFYGDVLDELRRLSEPPGLDNSPVDPDPPEGGADSESDEGKTEQEAVQEAGPVNQEPESNTQVMEQLGGSAPPSEQFVNTITYDIEAKPGGFYEVRYLDNELRFKGKAKTIDFLQNQGLTAEQIEEVMPKRAHNPDGSFAGDDPSTPEKNEAYA